MIMQIGFTSKEINSLPQLWGLKLQNNLYFENFENLPKEKITWLNYSFYRIKVKYFTNGFVYCIV